MKRICAIIILLSVILVSLFTTNAAVALTGGTWVSGIKIQNLTSGENAQLNIDLYDSQGNLKHSINQTSGGQPLVAPPGKSVEVYLPNFSQVAAGQYSAVISSNANIGAIVTTTNYPYGMADSYNAMTPDTSVFVPYVYHNHNNWSTEIFIQNTTDSTVTGSATFTEPPSSPSYGDSGAHTKTVPINIPGRGVQSLDTSTSGYNDLGWFIGSATIQTSNEVVVMANQTRLVGSGDHLAMC